MIILYNGRRKFPVPKLAMRASARTGFPLPDFSRIVLAAGGWGAEHDVRELLRGVVIQVLDHWPHPNGLEALVGVGRVGLAHHRGIRVTLYKGFRDLGF
jgi:hypothetical protein